MEKLKIDYTCIKCHTKFYVEFDDIDGSSDIVRECSCGACDPYEPNIDHDELNELLYDLEI